MDNNYQTLHEIAVILTNGNKQAVADIDLLANNIGTFVNTHREWCAAIQYDDVPETDSEEWQAQTLLIFAYWLAGYKATSDASQNPVAFGAYIDWKEDIVDIIYGLNEADKNLGYGLDLEYLDYGGLESTDDALQMIADFLSAKGLTLLSLDTQGDCYHLFVIRSADYQRLHQLTAEAGFDFISDFSEEGEYIRLKTAFAQGEPFAEQDIERLARMLHDHCRIHSQEDDEPENASEELEQLFACLHALPGSDVVRKMTFDGVLVFIQQVGEYDIDPALTWLNRLMTLAAESPADRLLSRVCANAMVLIITEYLDMDEPQTEQANELYETLQTFAQPYLYYDPVMPAMLAWAQQTFISQSVYTHDAPQVDARMEELKAFSAQYPDNPLVAAEYATSCYACFIEALTHSTYNRAYDEMLPEIQRLVRTYSEQYRHYTDAEPGYKFPGYFPNKIDDYLSKALYKASLHETEQNRLEPLIALYARLTAMEDYPFQLPSLYRDTQRLMCNHLAKLYGDAGQYDKMEEMIASLRKLVLDEPVEEQVKNSNAYIYILSDALYNLVCIYVDADPLKYRVQIQTALKELEALAARTDKRHEHTRYAMALYNLAIELKERRMPFIPVWDRIDAYIMVHTVDNEEIAKHIADQEAAIVGKTGDVNLSKLFHNRVLQMAQHPVYKSITKMPVYVSMADYNLLVVASDAKKEQLAVDMFASLTRRAAEYTGSADIHREIVLRFVKAGMNMMCDYGDMHDLINCERVWTEMRGYASTFARDTEIANRLVNTAYNLCIDMKNAGRLNRVREIYADIAHVKPDGASVERLEQLRSWAPPLKETKKPAEKTTKSLWGQISKLFSKEHNNSQEHAENS